MPNISRIVTHLKPHLDEIVAIWMLWRWGKEKYPGVDQAAVEYWSGGKSPDNRSAEEWEADGFLLVGVGGGRFDEHRNGQASPECAATLVAKDLGLDDDPALAKILAFTHRIDTRGGSQPFDLFSLTKLVFQHVEDPEEAFTWAIMALDAKYAEQEQGQVARLELANAEIHDLVVGGRPCRLAALKTDNTMCVNMARASVADGGLAADVVIAQRSSGHAQIFCNRQNWRLEDVARILRVGERSTKGLEEPLDAETLAQEGKVEGAEEWHYQKAGQMLLNGSLSHRDVPVTQLSFEVIVAATILGVRSDHLPHEHCRETKQCLGQACSFYCFGLERCQSLRQQVAPQPINWRSLRRG